MKGTSHMISPNTKQTCFPFATVCLSLAFLSAAYLMAAQIFGFWPLKLPDAAGCPATATNNQIFVDPTGSNQHTENWKTEAHSFAQTLGSCAHTSFWTVDDNSSSGAAYEKPMVFPLVDPNAPGAIRINVEKEIEGLRTEVEERIARMLQQKGAAHSDVIGIFNRLEPETDRRNSAQRAGGVLGRPGEWQRRRPGGRTLLRKPRKPVGAGRSGTSESPNGEHHQSVRCHPVGDSRQFRQARV
jgi:hypothetical protein